MPLPLILGPIIAALAPILLPDIVKAATGEGAVANKVSEAAVAVVSQVTGIPISTPAEAQTAVLAAQADPAKLADLYRLQGEQLLAMLTLETQDRASARQQTVDLAKAGSAVSWGAPVVSLIVVAGFFCVMALLFFIPQSDMGERTFNLLNMLFGALVIGFGQVTNFWLGSSYSSFSKDRTIASIGANMTDGRR